MTIQALNIIAPLATAAGITTAKQLGQFARTHQAGDSLALVVALTNTRKGGTIKASNKRG